MWILSDLHSRKPIFSPSHHPSFAKLLMSGIIIIIITIVFCSQSNKELVNETFRNVIFRKEFELSFRWNRRQSSFGGASPDCSTAPIFSSTAQGVFFSTPEVCNPTALTSELSPKGVASVRQRCNPSVLSSVQTTRWSQSERTATVKNPWRPRVFQQYRFEGRCVVIDFAYYQNYTPNRKQLLPPPSGSG